MPRTVEAEGILDLWPTIEEIATQKGWRRIRGVQFSRVFSKDEVRFDVFIFAKNGKEEIITVVYRDKEKDLISAPEEILEGLGIPQE